MTDTTIRNEKDIVLTLGAAGSGTETKRIYRAGRDFQCIAVDTDGVVQIGIDQDATTGRFLRKGMGGSLKRGSPDFTYLEFTNTSAGAVSFTVQVSMGDIRDSRFNLIGTNVPFVPIGPATLDTPADVTIPNTSTATLIRAAQLTGNEVGIQNNGATSIRIGGATVDGTHGHILQAGAVFWITTSAAIYGWNGGAGAVSLALLATR